LTRGSRVNLNARAWKSTRAAGFRARTSARRVEEPRYPDLADVRGQGQARRALEIAAAGSHSLLNL
jgi:magnesium chelatase family protein